MYEKAKLNEAKFFFSLMEGEQVNRQNFTFYLRAFLSASRSVLQYSIAEIEANNIGQTWYNDYVSKHSPLGFFKDKRDVNIHYIPVEPSLAINITIHETLSFSESVRVVKRDKDENIISDRTFEGTKAVTENKANKPKVEYIYRFDEWNGTEDVLTLCSKYIQELENFISEGITKGFITG